jgi:hypothetical protein
MATRFEIYKQAVRDLEHASAELDQVHASLKDIGFQDLQIPAVGWVGNWPRIDSLVKHLDALREALLEAECPECDHAIAKHGDKYGCEYERGDVDMPTRDGGTILAAAGPCGCRWGLEVPDTRQLPRWA